MYSIYVCNGSLVHVCVCMFVDFYHSQHIKVHVMEFEIKAAYVIYVPYIKIVKSTKNEENIA